MPAPSRSTAAATPTPTPTPKPTPTPTPDADPQTDADAQADAEADARPPSPTPTAKPTRSDPAPTSRPRDADHAGRRSTAAAIDRCRHRPAIDRDAIDPTRRPDPATPPVTAAVIGRRRRRIRAARRRPDPGGRSDPDGSGRRCRRRRPSKAWGPVASVLAIAGLSGPTLPASQPRPDARHDDRRGRDGDGLRPVRAPPPRRRDPGRGPGRRRGARPRRRSRASSSDVGAGHRRSGAATAGRAPTPDSHPRTTRRSCRAGGDRR